MNKYFIKKSFFVALITILIAFLCLVGIIYSDYSVKKDNYDVKLYIIVQKKNENRIVKTITSDYITFIDESKIYENSIECDLQCKKVINIFKQRGIIYNKNVNDENYPISNKKTILDNLLDYLN